MEYGVIYCKDPLDALRKLESLQKIDSTEYLVLHQKNMNNWFTILKEKKINSDRVYGIDESQLEYFGAIIPNAAEPFTGNQITYILAKRFTNPEIPVEELIGIIRKRKCSTPDLMRFNKQVADITYNLGRLV